MGQLLEYNDYYNDSEKADKLIIVSTEEPKKDDIEYLNILRKKYKLPVYYQQFDLNKKSY